MNNILILINYKLIYLLLVVKIIVYVKIFLYNKKIT